MSASMNKYTPTPTHATNNKNTPTPTSSIDMYKTTSGQVLTTRRPVFLYISILLLHTRRTTKTRQRLQVV